jgi:hypothetical protein
MSRADESEKRSLESIFRRVSVSQDSLADAENHPAVSLDEERESSLLAVAEKAIQQFLIA